MPYLSFTFPKHGLYIHEYIDAVSCESWTQFPQQPVCAALDDVASRRLQSINYILPMVARCIFYKWDFTDISQASCFSEKEHSQNHSINSHLSAPETKKTKKKISPLDLNPIRAFSFEIWLTNTVTKMEMERERERVLQQWLISLVISQNMHHRHE